MGIRLGIVAAEHSGDVLGAGLMRGVLEIEPDARFEGIGGPEMEALGLKSRVPMEELSIMGFVEVLKHLPRLLGIRRDLRDHWLKHPPDIFIGVDAPDFNLGLEQRLKEAGIPTVHYVSPTVWAWRPKRVEVIKKAVDLLLSIFPFEQKFLEAHHVPVKFVGHPLAQKFPLDVDKAEARKALGIDENARVLALLPGSRRSEMSRLIEPFLKAAQACKAQIPELRVVTPLIDQNAVSCFERMHERVAPDLEVDTRLRESRQVLTAADVVLIASGTATFEGLLCKRPMVVGYKVHWLTYWIAHLLKLIKVEHIAMSNLLADERLAPEFIQTDCNADNLSGALMDFFNDKNKVAQIAGRYRDIHESLQMDTNELAATAVLSLLEQKHDT